MLLLSISTHPLAQRVRNWSPYTNARRRREKEKKRRHRNTSITQTIKKENSAPYEDIKRFLFSFSSFFSFLLLLYRSFYTSGTSKSRPLNIKKKKEKTERKTQKNEGTGTISHAYTRSEKKKEEAAKRRRRKKEYEAQKLVMNECDRRYRNRY